MCIVVAANAQIGEQTIDFSPLESRQNQYGGGDATSFPPQISCDVTRETVSKVMTLLDPGSNPSQVHGKQ